MNRSNEILTVAHKLLVERGYNGFSYADISTIIGIQKASIHYHFPSKENLVQSVVKHYRSDVTAKMNELSKMEIEPIKKLSLYMDYWTDCLQNRATDVCLCAQLAAEIPMLPETVRVEVQNHFKDLTTWIASLLQEAVHNQQLNHLPADLIQEEAAAIMAAIHGGMLTARTFNNGDYFKQVTVQTLKKIEIMA